MKEYSEIALIPRTLITLKTQNVTRTAVVVSQLSLSKSEIKCRAYISITALPHLCIFKRPAIRISHMFVSLTY
jgi:hypothetical protein